MKTFVISYGKDYGSPEYEFMQAPTKLEAAQKFYIAKGYSRPEITVTIGEIIDCDSIVIRNSPQISIEKKGV